MMRGVLGGNDPEKESTQARDFIDRYTKGDPKEGYSVEEAQTFYQAAASRATPEQMQKAFRATIQNLPDNERAEFAEMLKQRQAGRGMVDIQRTGEVTAAGTAGSAGAQQGGGLDDLLGGLLGGAAGGGGLDDLLGGLLGGGSSGGRDRGGDGGGGGLGDILSGFLGGGASEETGATDSGGGGAGDLFGGLLDSPIGKAVIAGTAAFAMKELIDQD